MAFRLLFTAASLLALYGGAKGQTDMAFQAKAVSHTGTFRLPAALERIFPLFGPVREKAWAPGWNPTIIFPLDREVAEGMVFTTEEKQGTMYWVVTSFDPAAHRVAYANVVPGYIVNRIVVQCRALSANNTEVSVTYVHTALSDAANQFIQHMDAAAYDAKMKHWHTAITYALEHGRPMQMPLH